MSWVLRDFETARGAWGKVVIALVLFGLAAWNYYGPAEGMRQSRKNWMAGLMMLMNETLGRNVSTGILVAVGAILLVWGLRQLIAEKETRL